MNPKFSIIIPTYLHSPLDCLQSIKQFTDLTQVEVILVCNGAPAALREQVTTLGMSLTILWFAEPVGFSRAVNAGIGEASGEYVVLLNDDAGLTDQRVNGWLDILLAPFADPTVGITGVQELWSVEARQNFLIFFCVMIRRAVLDDIGLLDESFGVGCGEDTDYCVKATRAGWRCVQAPEGEVRELVPVPNSEHLPVWNQMHWVGTFPIYHAGEATLNQLPDHVQIVERNKALLAQRYKPVDIERAQGIEGWMGYDEMLWLGEQAKTRHTIVEIGSHAGKSTRVFADNTAGVVYAVDRWDDRAVLMRFYDNLSDHIASGKVRVVRMSSGEGAQALRWVNPDLCFIDADHEYEAIKADILNWRPLLAEGGLLCGHDYSTDYPGVVQAVNELLVSHVPPQTGIWEMLEAKVPESLLGYGGFFCTKKQTNSLSA